ncbi:MAG TPA: CBS domain-containing protein [Candidatus Micrarchaeaceae archaeon]|nr:CBS domain-containing protein [Candidatus Micrarchaeaceae archaeon]
MNEHKHADKRRVMVTQLLHSPVFNSAGEAMGHLEDLIVKMDGGGYPPVSGIKVRSVGRIGGDVFVSSKSIQTLAAGEVRLNTPKMDTTDFQRRPGEVLLAGDVLGRHLMDVTRGRIVQAHDLVIAPGADGWRLMGVDRSPRAMLRRLVPRRGRPDLRRHALLDWKDVQPFVAHVPTAKLLMPLQRLRRLHPAQIADLVEGATHAEGEEILDAVEGDAELTADVFEEMDTQHQVEFLRSLSNAEAARVLERMAPDDAADLFGELDQDRRKSIFDLMSAEAQHKLRKLLQYHPSSAGGMMSPDYISVVSGATVADALEAVRTDAKSPRQLLNTVFVIQQDGKLVGSVGVGDLLRSEASRKVDELDLVTCRITTSADLSDVTLMVADYNLIAVAVTDVDGNLVGAVSSDDVIEAIVPEDWRARIATSSSV